MPVVKGTKSNDNLDFSTSTTLNALSGGDTITLGEGDDTVRANNGNDTVSGGDGNDRLFGNGGNDTLWGGAGSDELKGGGGNDSLNGDAGNDNVEAGAGNDVLTYGLNTSYGADDLYDGGLGTDTLVLQLTTGQQAALAGELATFQAWLGANSNPASDLGPTFAFSFGLDVRNVESVSLATVAGSPPVADDETAATDEDTAAVLTTAYLLAGDTDPDPLETLSVQSVSATSASGASVSLNTTTGEVTYDPTGSGTLQALAAGANATDSFTYVVKDSSGNTDTGTVTVTVTGDNDAPEAEDVTLAAAEDGDTVVDSFSADDIDSDDDATSLTYTIVDDLSAGEGSVTNNNDGTFTFDPGSDFQELAEDEETTVSFTYKATDSHGADSDEATVTITVTGVNDAPVAEDVSTSGGEDDDSIVGSFAADDIDSDDDPASLVYGIVAQPAEGTVAVDGGDFVFVPGDDFQDLAAGESRDVTFTYKATDSHLAASNVATVTVTVNGENDDPHYGSGTTTAAVTELADGNANENTFLHSKSGSIAFTDVDLSDGHTVTVTAQGSGYLGTFTADTGPDSTGDGSGEVDWTFEVSDAALDSLAAGQTLTQTYDIEIDDGNGGTDTETVTVTATGANDAPVFGSGTTTGSVTELADGNASENSFTHQAAGSIAFTDVDLTDSHILSITPQGSGYLGTLTGAVGNDATGDGAGSVTWNFAVADSALDSLAAGQTLTQTYDLEIDDGNGGTDTETVTVTIHGAADAPPLTNPSFETGNFTGWSTIGQASVVASATEADGSGTISVRSGNGTKMALLSTGGTPATDADLATFLGVTGAALDALNGDAKEGSALKTTVTVTAGQQISFDWLFDTDEGAGPPGPPAASNDFGFYVSLAGSITKLSDFATVGTDGDSGWQTTTITAAASGTFTLAFGVVDVANGARTSQLFVDDLQIV